MHKYQVVINWSSADNAYIAQAPELLGCWAHGETYQEALAEIEQAIGLWIDTATEFGDPVPEPLDFAPSV